MWLCWPLQTYLFKSQLILNCHTDIIPGLCFLFSPITHLSSHTAPTFRQSTKSPWRPLQHERNVSRSGSDRSKRVTNTHRYVLMTAMENKLHIFVWKSNELFVRPCWCCRGEFIELRPIMETCRDWESPEATVCFAHCSPCLDLKQRRSRFNR